jgi:hypothetical protein
MNKFKDIGKKHQQHGYQEYRSFASGWEEKVGEQKCEHDAENNSNEQNPGLQSGQSMPHPLFMLGPFRS